MKHLTLDIFLGERFYGTLRVRNLWGGGIPITEQEIASEVEKRLPFLKGKKYTISL